VLLARLAAPVLGQQGVQLTGADTRPVRQQNASSPPLLAA